MTGPRSPWTDVLAAVLALAAMGFVGAGWANLAGTPAEGLIPEVEHMMTGQALATIVVFVFAALWRVRPGWRGERGLGAWIVGVYVLWMLLWVPLSLFVYPWFVAPEPQPHLEYFVIDGAQPRFLLVVVVVCLLGPIAEEIVFRGYLQEGLVGLLGRWPGLVVTSLLFGFLHGLDIGLPLSLMGLLFGYLRLRDRGMLAPIAAHVLHNSAMIGLALGWPELFHEVFQ